MEEYAIVLDYLPQGRPEDKGFKKSPLILGVGESEFKLLEMIPKSNAIISVGEKIYIGANPDLRTKIVSVKRRISYRDLTHAALNELPFVLESIITSHEERFVNFFNQAQPINTRLHSLELLPGLGNKTMWNIIEARKNGPFKSFSDLTDRVRTLHNPQKMIAGRMVEELEERYEKYKLFVSK
ncbi:MAG: DUF655 domain-containing protein [Candidatus Thermoplasmatota archaeon]|nr:DUF655 domain-containing protein [Candidatus Thermoplasmatota archaeon]